MGEFIIQKTENKEILLEQLKNEVNADGTISAEAVLSRIVHDGVDQYYFDFDDTAFDNDGALSGAADTALLAVIAAHTPAGQPPTDPPPLGFKTKAGRIPAGNFSGNPQVATVTFGSAFQDYENYVVTFSVRVTNQNTQYIPTISAYDETGFTVSLGTSSTANLTEVCWIAVVEGEE